MTQLGGHGIYYALADSVCTLQTHRHTDTETHKDTQTQTRHLLRARGLGVHRSSTTGSPLGKKESIQDTAIVASRFVDAMTARVYTRQVPLYPNP
eukprot:2234267-Rhodomonas_salina.1